VKCAVGCGCMDKIRNNITRCCSADARARCRRILGRIMRSSQRNSLIISRAILCCHEGAHVIATLVNAQRKVNEEVGVATADVEAFEWSDEGVDAGEEEGDGEAVDVTLLLELEVELERGRGRGGEGRSGVRGVSTGGRKRDEVPCVKQQRC
jgi:hypothetical protein